MTKADASPPDDVTENLPRNAEYRVLRAPDLFTVTPGARVQYTAAHRSGTPPTAIGGRSSYRDAVKWFKFRERALLEDARDQDRDWGKPVEKGPIDRFVWSCTWGDSPGRYVVAAEIRSGTPDPTYCFLPQHVEDARLVLARSFDDLSSGAGPTCDEAEKVIGRHIANLAAIEARAPIRDPKAKRDHLETVALWKDYAQRLRALLAPTDGRPRIPLKAVHLDTVSQQRRRLQMFLCRLDDEPKWLGGTRHRWALVDWTDPTDARFHGAYVGTGSSVAEAVETALRDWDWGNRLPEGRLALEIPSVLSGKNDRRELTTNGKSLGDEIKGVFEWIAMGALVVSGVAWLFVPIPALAAGAMWTSILSSTGASTIGVSQRWRAGVFDWREDAFDGLTIISNVFAASGAWARGARVLARGAKGETVTKIFLGVQIGGDLVQGVLIAEDAMAEYEQIMAAPDLLPEERSRRLLELFRRLSLTGLMSYVSIRANASELRALNDKPKHVTQDPRARPAGEKLEALTDPHGVVDTTKPPITEGHTNTPAQKTVIKTGAEHHPKRVSAEETEFARAYPADPERWIEREITKNSIALTETNLKFGFMATCDNGTLTITIVTKVKDKDTGEIMRSEYLRAGELYPKMYRHFESVGNPVKKLRGGWHWDNYKACKRKLDELLANGVDPDTALREAVRHAITYKKYHEPQGFTVLESVEHIVNPNPEKSSIDFVFRKE